MSTRKLSYTALQAAAIFTVTFLVRLPVPALSGAYVNFGDAAIYLCAYLFGGLPTAFAAAVGSALADLTAGAAVYIPATAIIKGLMGLTASIIIRQGTVIRFIIAAITCGAIMTVSYFSYETVLFGGNYAKVSFPFNLAQWGGTVAVSTVLYPFAARLKGRCPIL